MTAAAAEKLVDIHDRRPLVLAPEDAWEWMRQDVTGRKPITLPETEQYPPTVSPGTRYRVPWVM